MLAQNVSKHVAKELRRHVKPNQVTLKDTGGEKGRGNIKTLFCCVAFVGVTASIPLLAMHWIGPLNEKDEVSSFLSNKIL